MDQLVTILRKHEAGPVHIEVDDEWEHDVQVEDAEMGERGFHAEGRDLEAEESVPVHDAEDQRRLRGR